MYYWVWGVWSGEKSVKTVEPLMRCVFPAKYSVSIISESTESVNLIWKYVLSNLNNCCDIYIETEL